MATSGSMHSARSEPATCRKQSTTVLCGLYLRGPAETTNELDGKQIPNIAALHVFLLRRQRFEPFYGLLCGTA